MTPLEFHLWNICFASLTSLWMIPQIVRDRFLLAKPSVVIVLAHHLFFQWPASLWAPRVEEFLPDSFTFALLIHVFPLMGFAVSMFIGRQTAAETWHRLSSSEFDSRRSLVVIRVLAAAFVVLLLAYVSAVPLSASGLAAILSDPTVSAAARESSLKLVANPLVRYAFFLLITVVGPLLAVLLMRHAANAWRGAYVIAAVCCALFTIVILLSVSLTGARAPAAQVLLVLLAAAVLVRGVPIRPHYLLGAIALVLATPVLLTILREGRLISAEVVGEYFSLILRERVIEAPLKVGAWYIHYTQTHSFFGIAGIPRLAALVGVDAIDVPNLIGLRYVDNPLPSVSAGAGYLFSYYSYLGPVSLLFTLPMLWATDCVLWAYRRVSSTLLLPTVAVVSVISINFLYADFTTVLITHGFIGAVVAALLLSVPIESGRSA